MYHWTSKPAGYKIWVGDLPRDTTAGMVNDNVWTALYQRTSGTEEQRRATSEASFSEIRDIVVKQSAAATGASYCCLTVGTKRAACVIYTAIYHGWEADTQIAGQERRKNAMHWLPVSSEIIQDIESGRKGKGGNQGKGKPPWAAAAPRPERVLWQDTRPAAQPVRFKHPGSPILEPGHPEARGPPRLHHSLIMGQPDGQPGQPADGQPGQPAASSSSGLPADALGQL
jgi:hypothetical protein